MNRKTNTAGVSPASNVTFTQRISVVTVAISIFISVAFASCTASKYGCPTNNPAAKASYRGR